MLIKKTDITTYNITTQADITLLHSYLNFIAGNMSNLNL